MAPRGRYCQTIAAIPTIGGTDQDRADPGGRDRPPARSTAPERQTVAHSRARTLREEPLRRFAPLLLAVAAIAAPTAHATSPKETLPSGVVVEHLKDGTGPTPKATDTVVVHYRGTLESGVEFDSSHKRGQPASFALGRVIPCWTEGIQRVRVGGRARLTCPGRTAYGERGIPGTIPPNATLLFEVELIGIR
jgi:FKBP-type peptidyl-prolyl cis-trans isomerase FkpA